MFSLFKVDVVSPHMWTKVYLKISPCPQPTMWDNMKTKGEDSQPRSASSVQKQFQNWKKTNCL